MKWLAENGIGSVLSLTEEPLPDEWTKGFGMESGHIPMKDHKPPNIESMERGVEYIREQLGFGRAVAVHCLAGEGRTGCVLAAYLIKSKGIGADEAIRELRTIKPRFVEKAQLEAVASYATSLKR